MTISLTTACILALATRAFGSPVETRQALPFSVEPVGQFNEPWSMAFLPDDRLLVTEKSGVLVLIDPRSKAKATVGGVPTVKYAGQGGLGDVALHPQFRTNKLVYLSYVEAGAGNESGAAVARARLETDENGGGALRDVEVVWRQSPKVDSGGHFSHRILFGADDNDTNNTLLWLTSGDRQMFDPAQDMSANLGKILRLNDDGTVPEGNPFADRGGVAAQVWALGVRNPLGFDFDADGNLWEVEMGPRGGDEFNLITRAGNYGWPVVSEGDHYDGEPIPDHDTRPEFLPPRVSWNPVISPASMIVYKGDAFPRWKGSALISGLGAQGLVRVDMSGDTAREAERIPMGKRMRCIRENAADGGLWALEDGAGGRLLRLTPS